MFGGRSERVARMDSITNVLVLWPEERNVVLFRWQVHETYLRVGAILGIVVSAPLARMLVVVEGNFCRSKLGYREDVRFPNRVRRSLEFWQLSLWRDSERFVEW
jgi:hypothetical protein